MLIRPTLARLLRALFDDVFPPTCAGCDRAECSEPLCPACAAALPEAPVRRDVPQLEACLAGASYEGFVLERIQSFKYPRSRFSLEPAPERFAASLVLRAARPIYVRPDAVVPVPQHPKRIRQRGFVPARSCSPADSRGSTACRVARGYSGECATPRNKPISAAPNVGETSAARFDRSVRRRRRSGLSMT